MTNSICWSNCNSYDEAEIIIIGIPDESHSHSSRKGVSKAPDMVRKISRERDVFIENNVESLTYSITGRHKSKIFDMGNISRDKIQQTFEKISCDRKLPVTIGGDHSLTFKILQTLSNQFKPISLVYFDAHPDFLSSTRNFYGSVVFDSLPFIDVKSSVMIGIRSPEQEEVENIKKYGIQVFSPFDIEYYGLKQTIEEIQSILGKNVYVSFDMDCIDPSFAPGVSVPVPMGLSNTNASILLKNMLLSNTIGMDIMEICPDYDIQHYTTHLASRLISEFCSSTEK